MKKKIFIDGKAGTTGLRIYERLADRDDVELLLLSDDERKDPVARKKALNSCDIAFLCLPDDAARESVSFIENENVVIIDTSTAHRTDPAWSYGFPELSKEFAEKILNSKRIAVPGCHASGFIALVYPLIEAGVIGKDTLLTCFSLTGYSGGGKKMIADYENEDRCSLLDAPRQYALTQSHKHLKEMRAITGIDNPPAFCPVVGDFYSGMQVTVPLFSSMLNDGHSIDSIKDIYRTKYQNDFVRFHDGYDDEGFLSAVKLGGKDSMVVTVTGNEDRILLIATYDNLGKGASGAAVECMNMVMNADRSKGLVL